jgi:hypothetical protein
MEVLPKDRDDFVRLVSRLESMSVLSKPQAALRCELLAKLGRYDLTSTIRHSAAADPARESASCPASLER